MTVTLRACQFKTNARTDNLRVLLDRARGMTLRAALPLHGFAHSPPPSPMPTSSQLGDSEVKYNTNFRFFISTKLANPHYPPEISTKTTIVNFAVKEEGLKEQLLGLPTPSRPKGPRLPYLATSLVNVRSFPLNCSCVWWGGGGGREGGVCASHVAAPPCSPPLLSADLRAMLSLRHRLSIIG